jgi:hypothetical protein
MVKRIEKQAVKGEGRTSTTTYRGRVVETVSVLGVDMPAELAHKLLRHLQSKTKTGRLIASLEAQEARRPH